MGLPWSPPRVQASPKVRRPPSDGRLPLQSSGSLFSVLPRVAPSSVGANVQRAVLIPIGETLNGHTSLLPEPVGQTFDFLMVHMHSYFEHLRPSRLGGRAGDQLS